MAADLGFVAHAAQRHLHELPSHCLGNRPHDGRLAHARRAREAQDGALHIVFHAQHRQVLDDALLHLFQPVVVFLQHAARAFEVQVVRRGLAPGQVENPLHIRTAHADFRRAGGHAAEPLQLLLGLLARLIIERGLFQALAQVLHIGSVLVAKLGLNGLDLLAQVIVLLVFLNLLLDAGLHLLLHIGQLGFTHQNAAEGFQPVLHLQLFQNGLTVLQSGEHVGGDDVGQLVGLVHVHHGAQRLLRHTHAGIAILFKKGVRGTHQRLHLGGVGRYVLTHQPHGGHQARVLLQDGSQHPAADTLHQHTDAVAGQVQHLLDLGNRAHAAQIAQLRLIDFSIHLCHQKDALVAHHGLLQRGHALGPAHIKVQHHMGKNHHPPERKHRHAQQQAFAI